jgi:hypothetical protein
LVLLNPAPDRRSGGGCRCRRPQAEQPETGLLAFVAEEAAAAAHDDGEDQQVSGASTNPSTDTNSPETIFLMVIPSIIEY